MAYYEHPPLYKKTAMAWTVTLATVERGESLSSFSSQAGLASP